MLKLKYCFEIPADSHPVFQQHGSMDILPVKRYKRSVLMIGGK